MVSDLLTAKRSSVKRQYLKAIGATPSFREKKKSKWYRIKLAGSVLAQEGF